MVGYGAINTETGEISRRARRPPLAAAGITVCACALCALVAMTSAPGRRTELMWVTQGGWKLVEAPRVRLPQMMLADEEEDLPAMAMRWDPQVRGSFCRFAYQQLLACRTLACVRDVVRMYIHLHPHTHVRT